MFTTFSAAILVSVVLGLVTAGLFYANKSSGQRLMNKVAREFGCDESQPYRFRNRHYVRMVRQGIPFFASKFALRGTENLRVVSIWKEPSHRLRIHADRIPKNEKPFMALEDIEVGNPGFDSDYIVNSNYPQRVKQLLLPNVQLAIQNLGLNIALFASGNRIQMDYWIEDPESKITSTKAIEVINQFMVIYFGMHGVPFEDISTLLSPEELAMNLVEKPVSICMVCGESVEDGKQKVIECRGCHSRHHQECWEYLGGCSTYACGEINGREIIR